jgi:hypothetical protein
MARALLGRVRAYEPFARRVLSSTLTHHRGRQQFLPRICHARGHNRPLTCANAPYQ